MLPNEGEQVWFLVGELRSHVPRGLAAKKKQTARQKTCVIALSSPLLMCSGSSAFWGLHLMHRKRKITLSKSIIQMLPTPQLQVHFTIPLNLLATHGAANGKLCQSWRSDSLGSKSCGSSISAHSLVEESRKPDGKAGKEWAGGTVCGRSFWKDSQIRDRAREHPNNKEEETQRFFPLRWPQF